MMIEVKTLVTFGRWVVTEKNVKGDLWYALHVLFLVGGICLFCNNSLSYMFMICILSVIPILHWKV